ncbi:RNA polymerase factor sigma-70 [Robbsia andropogonis]|uniref:RNA polymerase factor sigma-70 n=1 Tax=Robbsia andropogonis TaxID=28092 RepID=A0A0F5K201_9BURK|nr:RNA polymerase sigma factor [Robbsia andropogonis]KKB63562.1 RNA polymerase factor sigma-70 [Robbsia andropogonis]MCP1116781.1 RNA polymerase sigma factor [Robbsia andropogonis]MCP1126540.1 RNA polymerase sigma factor [Robbsia andropogonis]
MASDKELGDFLQSAERRAFKQTLFAVRDEDAALDIVQDAMIKLAEHYGDKPAAELPFLFQRILQTTALDYFRRKKVRDARITLFSSFRSAAAREEGEDDAAERIDAQATSFSASSEDQVSQDQIVGVIETEIQRLPARQREAFVMRYWEDMDVAETAAAMGCSEGSVKTHCSRAVRALAEALHAKGITL